MDKWIPYIITAVCSLVVGYLIAYLNHGLTGQREANERRRRFRDELRSIPLRFDGIHPMHFVKTYNESVPIVKEVCVKIFEDIKFLKRRDFVKFRDKYCGFKPSDLELPHPKTPAGLSEYMVANQKKREDVKVILWETLNKIAKCAQ